MDLAVPLDKLPEMTEGRTRKRREIKAGIKEALAFVGVDILIVRDSVVEWHHGGE